MASFAGDFMKLWTQSDQESERKLKKLLLAGLDRITMAQPDFLSKVKVGPDIAGPVVRWMEEWSYPYQVTAQLSSTTLTFSGKLFGEDITSENIKRVIRVGTILERPSDGVQMKVTDISGLASSPYTATVAAYGNTTLSDDSSAITYDIISEVWYDYKDVDSARDIGRGFREVGTQIHAETFEIPKTRENTRYEIVADEVNHQIQALLYKLRTQIARAVLRSRPYHDGSAYVYGNKTEQPTMCGICTWPVITQAEMSNADVYVNKNGAPITKDDLDDLVRNMWLTEYSDFNQGDWWIVCHPITHSYIQDFEISYRRKDTDDKSAGFHVENFDAKIGKTFPILSEQHMRKDMLLVVNFDKISYGYYKNDRIDRKEIATQGRYKRWLISMQTYGTVVRNPRQSIGVIYGLPTS